MMHNSYTAHAVVIPLSVRELFSGIITHYVHTLPELRQFTVSTRVPVSAIVRTLEIGENDGAQ
jgi:hypothetical protein